MVVIRLTDIHGRETFVAPDELSRAITESPATIFGMSLSCVLEFRRVYTARGGRLAITPESIKEVFK